VIIQDEKTHKDYLGFVPCNRGGGPYIFETRPRELLGYYQLVNVKFKNGKKIYSKEFGELKRYITTFETYYPLEQCSKCGSISAPIAPPGFIFPEQNPTATPIPSTAAAAFPSTGLLGVDTNYLTGIWSSFSHPKLRLPRMVWMTLSRLLLLHHFRR
jgi:hypothetical protein